MTTYNDICKSRGFKSRKHVEHSLNHIVKIIMTDPAETSDPTGIVGIQGNLQTGIIEVKLARQIKDKDKHDRLRKTGAYLSLYQKKISPSFMGIELNNRGSEIKKKLEARYDIVLRGVSTSSHLTKETREKGHAMDKPYMVKWFAEQKKLKKIVFPTDGTADMNELIDQIAQISSYMTPNGSTSYKAARGRHDDLFMALLLCYHIFLVYLARWKLEHQ